jgi:hypothetical protein
MGIGGHAIGCQGKIEFVKNITKSACNDYTTAGNEMMI